MHQSTLDFCPAETYNSQLSIFGFVDVRLLPGGENHGSFFPWTDLELEAIIKQVKATGIIPGLAASAKDQAQQQKTTQGSSAAPGTALSQNRSW